LMEQNSGGSWSW